MRLLHQENAKGALKIFAFSEMHFRLLTPEFFYLPHKAFKGQKLWRYIEESKWLAHVCGEIFEYSGQGYQVEQQKKFNVRIWTQKFS